MAKQRKDELTQAIEQALAPGRFVDYRQSWDFVEQLEAVRGRILPHVKSGEAARAAALFETFIAGCYEKSEEIDDSGGTFGQFVSQLFCDWIRARQGAKASAEETVAMLLSWMENDNYGYCYGLEGDAAKALDRKGLAAFERAVRDRPPKDDYARRRQVELLKAIYVGRSDPGAYAEVCGDDLTARDCEVLAEICRKRRRLEEALGWAERGIEIDQKGRFPGHAGWGLENLRREILTKLGRGGDALASAWDAYHRRPSPHSYDDLMKFAPKPERAEWREKAIGEIGRASLDDQLSLFVKLKERERLAEVVGAATWEQLADLSHHTTQPAARGLVKSRPDLAAKLQVAMARRILDAGKSKYYDAALSNLEQARKLLLTGGREREWERIESEIRKDHGRKYGFMPRFEDMVKGRRGKAPSFLERARTRWDRGSGRGRSGGGEEE